MKKPGFYILFCLFSLSGLAYSQNPTYEQLVAIIKAKSPHLDLSEKVLAFQLWSSTDSASRKANREFEKVAYTFHYARLKNGGKGTVVISCNTDDKSTAFIAFQQDRIQNAIPVSRLDYPFLSQLITGTNIVYDNTRQKVYENLAAGTIFKSYNLLSHPEHEK